MMMKAIAAVMMIALAAPLRAQTRGSMAEVRGDTGARVRLTDVASRVTTGTLAGVTGDTILILQARATAPTSFALASIREIDRREPATASVMHRHRLIGMVSGLVLGAGIGLLVAQPRVRRAERLDGAPYEQIDYVLDPIAGALLGGGAGLILGSWPTYRWVSRYVRAEGQP
jgi:hypothetical protein